MSFGFSIPQNKIILRIKVVTLCSRIYRMLVIFSIECVKVCIQSIRVKEDL